MKFISYLFLLSSVLFASCLKTDTKCQYEEVNTVAPQPEVDAIQQYLTTAGITDAIKHPAGFFYKIQTPGTGEAPGLCNQIGILYKGQLTNGTIFDQTTNNQIRVFTLGQLILGWQKGIPLIKTGGNITLYLPPTLGYGSQTIRDNQGNVLIPANSILIFSVQLITQA